MSISLIIKSNPGIIQLLDDAVSSFDKEGWIDCLIQIKVDCFDVSLHSHFYKPDFDAFKESIEEFYGDKRSTIKLVAIEDYLLLEGKIQDNGLIFWKCTIRSINNLSNVLYFGFETDESILHNLSVALYDILILKSNMADYPNNT